MKLTNLTSSRGNKVPNQFKVETENEIYYQSYESVIIRIENEKTFLDAKYWNYSKTTAKYRNQFLGETTKETEQKIKEGIYILTNLN